ALVVGSVSSCAFFLLRRFGTTARGVPSWRLGWEVVGEAVGAQVVLEHDQGLLVGQRHLLGAAGHAESVDEGRQRFDEERGGAGAERAGALAGEGVAGPD